MKFAMREMMIPGATLPERLTWLERTGLDAIELHGPALALPPAELRAIFDDSPIALASLDGGVGLLDPDPAKRAMTKEQIRARIDLAGAIGARGVLLVPQFGRGPALPDLAPLTSGADLERALLIAQLKELVPVAAAAGIPLYLEPLNRYEAYIVNRIEQGMAIAAEVAGEGNLGVMADFFHMGIEEVDIAASVRAAAGRIVHVHVADSNRLLPGRGHLDFGPGFAALKAGGYDGYHGFECRLDDAPNAAVAASMAYLRRVHDAA
ncbi:MAG: sugar phosphate isomerase/epimerase [Chloroflexia bacterium]|nr:sugar phosphate isomerase/epimerase [Chloroflexia bacterium]